MSVTPGPSDYGAAAASGPAPANLADILERVLDKGLVVAGDIRVNLLDIELLTVKLRLVIASLETAREVGIDWWERDPWLQGREDGRGSDREGELEAENRRLRRRVAALESGEESEAVESEDTAAALESGTESPRRGGRELESAPRPRERRRDD